MRYLVTASGRRKRLPDDLDAARVAGLDPAGRIVVDDFNARAETRPGAFLFGLTLCCNAYDKGGEDGVYCRGCYDTADIGAYLFAEDGFSGLDPVVTIAEATVTV